METKLNWTRVLIGAIGIAILVPYSDPNFLLYVIVGNVLWCASASPFEIKK